MELLNVITVVGFGTMFGAFIYVGRKLQSLDHIEMTMEKMKHNIKVIGDSLVMSDIAFDGGNLQAYSPIRLTNTGRELLERSGFMRIFDEHADDFYVYIDHDTPTTDYDIETAAIRSVFFLFDKPYFNPAKEFLYNNPTQDKKELAQVAGIYVRDKYNERKNKAA